MSLATPLHRKRALLLAFTLCTLALATFFVLRAFNENLLFYFTPTDVAAGKAPEGHPFRAGGMVKHGSITRKGLDVRFIITDLHSELAVHYTGILPDLFKEDSGVIVRGEIGPDKTFTASEVLAKHDENYTPPDVEHMLRDQREKMR